MYSTQLQFFFFKLFFCCIFFYIILQSSQLCVFIDVRDFLNMIKEFQTKFILFYFIDCLLLVFQISSSLKRIEFKKKKTRWKWEIQEILVSKSITHEYFIHGLLPIVVMGKRKSVGRNDHWFDESHINFTQQNSLIVISKPKPLQKAIYWYILKSLLEINKTLSRNINKKMKAYNKKKKETWQSSPSRLEATSAAS